MPMILSTAHTNEARADRAELALSAYTQACSEAFPRNRRDGYACEPTEDRIGDLIVDLLHLAARESHEDSSIEKPTELLSRARYHYEAEIEQEDDQA